MMATGVSTMAQTRKNDQLSQDAYWQDDFTPLQAAGKAVLAALREDESAPDADLYTKFASSGVGSHLYFPVNDKATVDNNSNNNMSATTTGGVPTPPLATTNINNNNNGTAGIPTTATIAHQRSVPLPPHLAAEIRTARLSSLMGLLPEADLAWMSVDEKLFIWPYDPSTTASSSSSGAMDNFSTFVIPSGQCVVSVGIVRPKKGVFKDVVEWCLVVTTPDEAILCALAKSNGPVTENDGFVQKGEILKLVPTRFVIATDSIPMLSVCGTSDGRIFMGGYDGGLYEMTYEPVVDQYGQQQLRSSLDQRLDAFYDGDDGTSLDKLDVGRHDGVAHQIIMSSKRALSSAIFGQMSNGERPRKARKLNHSSQVNSVVGAVVPGFLLKASSSIFGANSHSSTGGGPVTSIVADEERSCIYTLSSRGWICAFDICSTSPSTSKSTSEVKLMAVLDAPKTARLYLEAVSRGRMNAPYSSHSSSIGQISFPGSGSAAQAGVGGMDGARSILKLADSEIERQRSHRSRKGSEIKNVLTPVSIHVIPRKESGKLTLAAVTLGGLRYYLSSLSSSVLSSGPGQRFGTTTNRKSSDPLAPCRKFTLCHVRAPPPVDKNGLIQEFPALESEIQNGVNGYNPKIGSDISRVDASYYGSGVTLLAIENKGGEKSGSRNGSSLDKKLGPTGDIIVGTSPDSVLRKKNIPTTSTGDGIVTFTAPGGVSETLSRPMTTLRTDSSTESGSILPGGRIWDMEALSSHDSSVFLLAVSSETPTDVELSYGMVPEYFPPSRIRKEGGSSSGTSIYGGTHSALGVAEASAKSNALVVTQGGSANAASIAVTILSNFLLSRPLRHGLTFQKSLPQLEGGAAREMRLHQPLYRISTRYGCKGFSFTAAGKIARSKGRGDSFVSVARSDPNRSKKSTSKSARLSPWLLRPAVLPLNPLAIQHLIPSSSIVAVNSGGLHFFKSSSILSNLADALMASGINIGKDEAVTNFFKNYGYKQGCAMCLTIAVGCGPWEGGGGFGEELQSRALRAALSNAYVPRLVAVSGQNLAGPSQGMATPNQSANVTAEQNRSSNYDALIPPGYSFQPSSLSEGLTALLSRLLRPVWYKPAVVVTEGRTIRKKGGGTFNTPAKVELLLDDVTLEDIRKPLHALQALMRDVFKPAVGVVPGVQRKDNDVMDVDNDGASGNLITRAMQYQGFIRNQNNTDSGTVPQLTLAEIETIARLVEERYLHSIYRLLSRTVQLLTLLSLLKRAHTMADLPDVEWGVLHGLTLSQLVQTQEGQERVENLLNSLVSSSASATSHTATPSADADQLAHLFASQCYLYFSPGSRLAYLGFRSANEALSYSHSSARRAALTKQASDYLKSAARYWYSAPLITGRILHAREKNSYEQVALRAMRFDSPLAKAAAALIQLEDVAGVVDLCLETALNFGGKRSTAQTPDALGIPGEDDLVSMMSWEKGLYHRRRADGSQSSGGVATTPRSPSPTTASTTTTTLAVGADVRPKDALRTCYAIIFHHLSALLDSPNKGLADKMVAACAGASDTSFLHCLYEHLLETKHVDTLLRINSPEVEKWLANADGNLLWKFYVVQEKHLQAGQVMWKRACDAQLDTSLNDRIEYLTRALNSYNVALEQSTTTSALATWDLSSTAITSTIRPDEIEPLTTQIRETLDVANLQLRILNAVSSSSLQQKLDNESYRKLSSSLVPVSDLYNDYGGPLNLFDMCLLILHSCHHNEPKTIDTLWTSIICEEILPCSTRDPVANQFLQTLMSRSLIEERIELLNANGGSSSSSENGPLFENGNWITALKGRIVSLGKEVYGKGADYVFPVDLIVSSLETLRQLQSTSNVGTSWPLRILVEIGVPFLSIMEAYQSLAERDDREIMGGIDQQRKLKYLSNVVEVLQEWIVSSERNTAINGSSSRSPTSTNTALRDLSRAVMSNGLLSTIDTYKSSLESMIGGVNGSVGIASLDSNTSVVQRIYEAFTDIENTIQRLV